MEIERWRNGAAARAAFGCALVAVACDGGAGSPAAAGASAPAASARRAAGGELVEARDRGDTCSDVGSIRVCWGRECGHDGCVEVRPLPELPAPSGLGWRCTGTGAARRCVERAGRAGGFECRENTCVQRHPRLPDDGEWLCADAAGAVLCAGGEPAAGAAPAVADAGWFCGTRAGFRPRAATGNRTQPSPNGAPQAGPRVCVDLDPDFPDGDASRWTCHYAHARGMQRVCRPDTESPRLGARCDAARPCVDGSHCASGYCIVTRPSPECWLDADCKSSACRFGACSAID